MQLQELKAQISVLSVAIKSMDDLHDLGMKEGSCLEELQRIYRRIKLLKSARRVLLRISKEAKQMVPQEFTQLHLLQLAKERVQN